MSGIPSGRLPSAWTQTLMTPIGFLIAQIYCLADRSVHYSAWHTTTGCSVDSPSPRHVFMPHPIED